MPPTASAVISTRSGLAGMTACRSNSRRLLQQVQRQRAVVLDVAELDVMLEVIGERPFPRVIVGPAPESGVVGGAGVGEQRHRLVRPDAVPLQTFTPLFD